ncbi:flavin reductase family protein [Rhodospirillum sp. A1_3_36]|uniref:flavin reductase family protein n=1 Tax=Rhodospirillum sp. A1_3_36 TaxID=3391666 RepID=UPI0039A54EF6
MKTTTRNSPEIDLRTAFLDGMSRVATSVSVVTTAGPAGRMGVTVSAMSSVCADDPGPHLVVCVHRLSPARAAILENGVFCVNVLGREQAEVSDTFAGRLSAPGGDKFAPFAWTTLETGAPVLANALVTFDCRVTDMVEVGTHGVIFGAVAWVSMGEGADGGPLLHASRAYGAFAPQG